ncbi:Cas4 family endonuclease [Mycobacterium Phage Niklas]|uniref:Cas4 family endonuclease n=1 Tax=Mycobacterium Phage Niklas TaxID=2517936 RepID=A0A482JG01_9CAUD|nr:exonuclease [Mycobacterium Phage Niklas]ASR85946.1 Cas4 family endonuclease [Mycobacterium phage Peanam]QAY02793.1 Cas4 family endonuclease [Mycobacterium phage Shaobing]QBP31644.1 Cas4 family endonuclease [Mycobacterium Phage Niklas]
MSSNAGFFGLTDDAPARDRPQTETQEFNAGLLADLKGVFRRAWAQHGRSLQKALGPSEIGHPCPRRLASSMMEYDRINPEGDPLPAWLGTAGHTKFEDAVNLDNERLIDQWLKDRQQRCTVLRGVTGGDDPQYVGRWFTERRVNVRGSLSGTCDLYDTWTDTVIDLKFPGASRFQEYKKFGPIDKAPEYRVQAHAYGRGYRNEGFPVKRVAIWFIPRGGTLSASFVWSEPYSDEIIDQALDKLDNILIALDELRIDQHPERIALVPKVPSSCMFCPFFSPVPNPEVPHACTGDAE